MTATTTGAPATDPMRPFDADAAATLLRLVRGHRQAALATLDDGAPHVAMVAYAAEDGFAGFLLHLSDLAAHKRHLRADARCALLIFEPDDQPTVEVLTRKRVSLSCTASVVPKGGDAHAAAKATYLAQLPKHAMMFGLGDFDLVRLTPGGGLLNAGFGQAYRLTPADLATAAAAT